MKKLLFILTLFISASSFAQTKEETIAWIKEKLEKYAKLDGLNEKITVIKVDECEIVLRSDYRMAIYGDKKLYTISEMPITSFKEIKEYGAASGFNEGELIFTADVVKHSYYDGSSGYKNKSFFHIRNREENIYARMEKAIKHLATFCPKKKEAF